MGMNRLIWIQRFTWFAVILVGTCTVFQVSHLDILTFQRGAVYRNISGSVLLLLMLLQWTLSIGRMVYRSTGAQWERWVDFHHLIALWLPVAAIAHFVGLGYGLLAALPVFLFVSLVSGLMLSSEASRQRWLPYHLIFSALTLGSSFIHLWRVIAFR